MDLFTIIVTALTNFFALLVPSDATIKHDVQAVER